MAREAETPNEKVLVASKLLLDALTTASDCVEGAWRKDTVDGLSTLKWEIRRHVSPAVAEDLAVNVLNRTEELNLALDAVKEDQGR